MNTFTAPGGALPLPETTFTFISDPSHGWLILSPAWLGAVGLTLADISTCSYQRADGILALEEDCDAPAFIKAFEARFGACCDLLEAHQDVTEIRNWPCISHSAGSEDQAATTAIKPEGEITYEIQRFPMIANGEDGYTLFDAVDHAGQTWAFIDVTVTKRVNDCLVDEVACVDGIQDIAMSDAVMQAFTSAFPMATTEDHLEDVAHSGPNSVATAA